MLGAIKWSAAVLSQRRVTATVAATVCAASLVSWCFNRRRSARLRRRVCKDPLVNITEGAGEVAERDTTQNADFRARYQLGSAGGFLPDGCLERLPPACDEWENIVDNLPDLNRSGRLVAAVDAMPVMELDSVLPGASPEELRRAFMVFALLSHSYCLGPDVPWHLVGGIQNPSCSGNNASSGASPKILPAQLAKPWFEVCCKLRMPPVLTAVTDLWNWRLKDPLGRIAPCNIDLISTMTGTSTETRFHAVPCAMQAVAAKIIPKLFLADRLLVAEADESLVDLLQELTDVLNQFAITFRDIAGVDPDIFYNVYRPCMAGFHPNGVALSSVTFEVASAAARDGLLGAAEVSGTYNAAAIVKSKGPSAGQSSLIQLFDLFLGVKHCPQGAAFQDEMLGYMPGAHRQMVLDCRERWKRSGMSVRDYVLRRCSTESDLLFAFNECVTAFSEFRRAHLSTVTRYLTKTSTGTGQSTWRDLLKSSFNSTDAAKILCVDGGLSFCPSR